MECLSRTLSEHDELTVGAQLANFFAAMRYRFEQWELDWSNRELRRGTRSVHVEPKVMQFLHVMLGCPGRLVTRTELQKCLWPNVSVGPDALARVVKESRKAIEDNGPEPRLLLTRRGHGFVFAGTVQIEEDSVESAPLPRSCNRSSEPLQRRVEDTTAIDSDDQTPLTVLHWVMPCKRITVLSRSTPTFLGRGSRCNEVFDDKGVSREHAVCAYQGPIAVLRDLSSRNGTYLNGALIKEAPLASNDVIRLGGCVGVVRRVASPESTRFECLGPDYYGGHDARQLLRTAECAQYSRILNVRGEPGSGKSAFVALLHERLRPNTPCVSVLARAQDPRCSTATLACDDTVPLEAILQKAGSGTLLFEDIDRWSHDRLAALSSLVAQLDTFASTRPRIITTSRVELSELAARAALTMPAYVALAGIDLHILPLRLRRSDILELATIFSERFRSGATRALSGRAGEYLLLQPWSFNVLELKDAIRKIVTTPASSGTLETHELASLLSGFGLG